MKYPNAYEITAYTASTALLLKDKASLRSILLSIGCVVLFDLVSKLNQWYNSKLMKSVDTEQKTDNNHASEIVRMGERMNALESKLNTVSLVMGIKRPTEKV